MSSPDKKKRHVFRPVEFFGRRESDAGLPGCKACEKTDQIAAFSFASARQRLPRQARKIVGAQVSQLELYFTDIKPQSIDDLLLATENIGDHADGLKLPEYLPVPPEELDEEERQLREEVGPVGLQHEAEFPG